MFYMTFDIYNLQNLKMTKIKTPIAYRIDFVMQQKSKNTYCKLQNFIPFHFTTTEDFIYISVNKLWIHI